MRLWLPIRWRAADFSQASLQSAVRRRLYVDFFLQSVGMATARLVAGVLVLAAVSLFIFPLSAGAEDLKEQLEQKRSKLGDVRERQGVLTSELEGMGNEISRLADEVAGLRAREIAVEARLAAKQTELAQATADLKRARGHLEVVRARLKRALNVLRERLVAIYETGSPDLLSVILNSADLAEIASQTEYLNLIQETDEAIAGRVRDLRDEAGDQVEDQRELRARIAAAREQIATREAELEDTRLDLEDQQGQLLSARESRREALAALDERESVLEGDVSDLQAEIQAQLGALTTGPYTSAPTSSPGSFIWPVEGTLTSNFGYRWGRQHEGIDIAAAEGTPIWAAASGTVVLQQSEYESGGYGNYTCLDHGGGLSTCYAHQSAFNVSPGQQVSQGEVIGLVGNTGHSFGAHLHFEVRVGGVAQNPLGYL